MSVTRERLQQIIADPDRATAEMAEYQRSSRDFDGMYDTLLADHDGDWVAVHNGGIAAVASTIDELVEMLQRNAIPVERCYLRLVQPRSRRLIV